jgi:4,5-DOPA dioxygenase extradiol
MEFAEWFVHGLEAGDVDALLDWEARAPHAAFNHPTPEHLMPLFVAMGAAGDRAASATPLHRGFEHGILAMDAWRFG